MKPIAGAALPLILLAGCAASLASRPGVFDASTREVAVAGRTYHVTYVKPAASASEKPLIVMFTGDAGWMGTSGMLLEHLAEEGYPVAGFDSRKALKPIKQSGEKVSVERAADALEVAFARAKSDLGLPASAPLIVAGFSRGATAVAFTAIHSRLHENLTGAIAIALTRESDYLKAPDPAGRPPEIQVDDQERIQIYPALDLMGPIPLAVIQSTNDKYVPSAESRRLLGPDTSTRRLYQVEARNHGFAGGDERLLHDLDDALRWIEQPEPRAAGAASPSAH